MARIRQLVNLGDVPDGDHCTKRNGEKLYRVKETIKIYKKDCEVIVIRPYLGHVFMVADGYVNEVSVHTPVLWEREL